MTAKILVLDVSPERIRHYLKKYAHLEFVYFGDGLDEKAMVQAARELLESELAEYAAIVVNGINNRGQSQASTYHGPTIARLTRSFVAKDKLVIGLMHTTNPASMLKQSFTDVGVTYFAALPFNLQQQLEELMRRGLLPSPASSGG